MTFFYLLYNILDNIFVILSYNYRKRYIDNIIWIINFLYIIIFIGFNQSFFICSEKNKIIFYFNVKINTILIQ